MKTSLLKISTVLVCFCSILSCGSSSSSKKEGMVFSEAFVEANYQVVTIGKSKVEDKQLTIRIEPSNNLITGYSGCNNYQYEYKLEGTQLSLGYATTSDMYCEETKALEKNFLGQMGNSTRFVVAEKMISFTNEKGEVFITAKRME